MKITLNLASQSYRYRRRVRWTLFLVTVLLVSAIGWEMETYQKLKEDEKGLNVRLERIRQDEEKIRGELRAMGRAGNDASLKKIAKEVAFANDLIYRKSFSWTRFLFDLETRVSRNVAIQRIQPTFDSGQVTIGGTARSLKALTGLMIQLQSDDTFEDVFLSDQKADPKSPVKDAVDFTIKFKYRGHPLESKPQEAKGTDAGAAGQQG